LFRALIHSADCSAAAFVKRSGLMRIAISAVAIASLFASSPALASPSCMTQSEARQKFPTTHLWWHGPNRCWDGTPSRTQLSRHIRARETKPVQAEEKAPRVAEQEKQPDAKKKPDWSHAPRWRDAMSKMRADDIPVASASARAQAGIEPVEAPAPRTNFWERWVDIAQRVPPIVDKAGPADLAADAAATEPIVTPMRVMLALLVLVVAFGLFELLFRRPRFDRRAD
jgi:hypothetical protein